MKIAKCKSQNFWILIGVFSILHFSICTLHFALLDEVFVDTGATIIA